MIWLVHSLGIQMCGLSHNDILIKVFKEAFNIWYALLHSQTKYKWSWGSPSHQAVLIWVTHSFSQLGSHIEMLHQIIILGPEIANNNETIDS